MLKACGVGVNGAKEPGACSQYINLDAGGIWWVKTFSILLEENNWNHCGAALSGCSRLEHIRNYQKTVTETIITCPSPSVPVLLGLSAKTWVKAELFIPAWGYIHLWVFYSSGLGGWRASLCHTDFFRILASYCASQDYQACFSKAGVSQQPSCTSQEGHRCVL